MKGKISLDSEEVKAKQYYCYWDKWFGFERHVWSCMFLTVAHALGFHGLLSVILGHVPRSVIFFTLSHMIFVGFGTTIGAHRYWSHKTFKAKLPLQIFLAYIQTAAGQNPIFTWCRDHRLHHKYTETDADPHDTRKGFWFTHMGWVLTKEHPAVKAKEATIDMSDLDNDPVVRFQAKYYWYIFLFAFYLIPMYIQHWFWPSMSVYQLLAVNYIWYLGAVHGTWLINSAAHRWGSRAFDKGFNASDNRVVAVLTLGEGWHNYHHAFPWDYRSSELGFYTRNWSIIDFLAWIGQAYDLKTVKPKTVADRARRTGDGSYPHPTGQDHPQPDVKGGTGSKSVPTWGWGDKDITPEEYQVTQCLRMLSG